MGSDRPAQFKVHAVGYSKRLNISDRIPFTRKGFDRIAILISYEELEIIRLQRRSHEFEPLLHTSLII